MQKQEEAKQREREENISPDETLSEKLESQQVPDDCTMNTAQDAIEMSAKICIDAMHATNKAEFNELAEVISRKVHQYKHLDDFPIFIEELIRTVCSICK